MATTVLVPSTRGVDALADLPEVRAVRFVPTEIPETGHDAGVMVVRSSDMDAQLALMAQLPQLSLVQTLSAGIDHWQGACLRCGAVQRLRRARGLDRRWTSPTPSLSRPIIPCGPLPEC